MAKVVIIGLDGATWNILLPLIKSKKLATLTNLVECGVSGNLRSVIPPISAPAWVSFMTGKNPGKHGIFDFVHYGNNTESQHQLVSSLSIRDKTLWEILGIYGKTVGSINVPVTYPPKKVNGFLISDFMTPPSAKIFTYPQELSRQLSDYKIDVNFAREWLFKDKNAPYSVKREDMLEEQYDVTKKRGLTVTRLMDEWNPDFLAVVFKGTDNLQHYFWDRWDVLQDYYQKLDEIIGDILSHSGKDVTVIIMSDHGFGPAATKNFYINSWLKQSGWLTIHSGAKSHASMRFYQIALRANSKLKLSRRLPTKFVDKVIKTSKEAIDWTNTKAYADKKGLSGIFINRSHAGKEASQYEELRKQIIEDIKLLNDPETGEKIIEGAYKKEELYSGPFTNTLPDIILLQNPRYMLSDVLCDTIIDSFKPPRPGDHLNGFMDGIFIANGPALKENFHIEDAKIYDIAPTVLHLCGVPVPDDMDGRVLKEIFREGSEPAQREIKFQPDSPEQERVKDKVTDLKILKKI